MPHALGHEMSPDMQRCIKDCLDCHSVCLETISYCLLKGGKHADPNHIRLLEDCAEICQTSANFMLRGSTLHARTCAVCGEACEQCARSCDQFGNDTQMKACAEACRRCSQSCREMAA